jgi:hypothetical protein
VEVGSGILIVFAVGYGKAGTARESQFGIIDEQKN